MATLVIIVLAIATMGVLGFMFMRGFGTGGNQISREQAISKCQSLCAEDQQKIYQLSGHPGVLDLPNEQNGISFIKPSSFCSQKFNVKGYGEVYCDQLTTCRVSDGDGDTGYLHCTDGIDVVGGGAGGGSGGTINIGGPLAQGVPLGEKVMSCDEREGNYIKFYVDNPNPVVGSKVKVWGIVCNGSSPVVNADVYLSWDNYPLSDLVYYEGFDELDPNQRVLKFDGWDFSDNFNDNALSMLGYLSPYLFRVYKDFDHSSPSKDVKSIIGTFTPSIDADEAQFRVISGKGPRIQNNKLTLAGQLSGVTFELTNGTNTTYIHYIYAGSGCMPGLVTGEGRSLYINEGDCEKLAVEGYSSVYPNIVPSNIKYNNVTLPQNNSNNKFIIIDGEFYKPTRTQFKHDSELKNSTLKKVYFELYVVGVGGRGGSAYAVDDFKLMKYKDLTKTNQFGMFSTEVQVPLIPGSHNISASTINGISASGEVNINATPNIRINFDVEKNTDEVKINGSIHYLNGTPINNGQVWLFVDGTPYSNNIHKVTYTFDDERELDAFNILLNSKYNTYTKSIYNGILILTGDSRWHNNIRTYLFFNSSSFISNISMDIKLKPVGNNYGFFVGLIEKNNEEGTQLPIMKWYISKKGNYYGREILPGVPPLPRFNDLPINEFKHIWFSPIELVNPEAGKIGTVGFFIGGWEVSGWGGMEIDVDNLTITSVGKMYTDENGQFEISIPKDEIGEGSHNITIIAYDQYGAEAKVTKIVDVV